MKIGPAAVPMMAGPDASELAPPRVNVTGTVVMKLALSDFIAYTPPVVSPPPPARVVPNSARFSVKSAGEFVEELPHEGDEPPVQGNLVSVALKLLPAK